MPEYINIKSDKLVILARGQAVVEASRPLEKNAAVLSVSAAAFVTPGEVFAGEARYLGRVKFDCLLSVDDRIECVSAIAEFSDKITAPAIETGMSVALLPEVINAEASAENGNLKMTAVVDTDAVAAVSRACDCLKTPDDGVYVERRAISYSSASERVTETAYMTDTVALSKASEILCSSSRAVVSSAQCFDGEIKVAGSVYTYIVLRADDTVTSVKAVTPFTKSLSALGVSEGDIALAVCSADETTVTLAEDGSAADIVITLSITAIAFSRRECEIVSDAFCADYETECERASVSCGCPQPLLTVTDSVDGQIPLPEKKPAADSVSAISGAKAELSSVTLDGGRPTAEGVVCGDIVYYNAEKNATFTLPFRIPFSISLSAHLAGDGIYALCSVTDISVRIRRESVFDIKAEMAFTLFASENSECEYIAGVKLGEEIRKPDASVIVHIAKAGESLWQAAKALGCSPERVAEQNAAAAPYAGGERLINFCNKKAKAE